MGKFIEMVINAFYEEKEKGDQVMGKTRTMAIQISEELFQKIKEYLAEYERVYHRRLTQKEFVIGLVEQALEEAPEESDAEETGPEETEDVDDDSVDPEDAERDDEDGDDPEETEDSDGDEAAPEDADDTDADETDPEDDENEGDPAE